MRERGGGGREEREKNTSGENSSFMRHQTPFGAGNGTSLFFSSCINATQLREREGRWGRGGGVGMEREREREREREH